MQNDYNASEGSLPDQGYTGMNRAPLRVANPSEEL